jgi:cytoskeletal protein RodZ
MELTPGQQRLVFVVVVLALAGLGIYLIQGRGSGGGTPSAAPSTSSAAPRPSASTPSAASVPPSAVPTTTTPLPTTGSGEIYQWLPFTAADLSAAAQTTLTFAKDYSTWSYTESTAAYAAKFNGLVTATELAALKNGYNTSGVAEPRAADKQVSTGSGTIDSIRAFGTNPTTSITFVVTINQQVTSTQPTSTASNQYAITVASSGGAWQVNDIELSKLGNA